jgi:transcriptional regulator with XRE-family HTH domain
MSELTENIREELKDKETRFIYDDDLLNTYIATQIRTLREQRDWTQQRLAEEAGMKQERISVLEDVNYSSWTAKVLRRLAEAFDLRLTIKFEEFNTYFKDFEGVKPELLERRSFKDDPAFKDEPEREQAAAAGRRLIDATHLFPDLPARTAAQMQFLPGMLPAGVSMLKVTGVNEKQATASTVSTTERFSTGLTATSKAAGAK